MTFNLDPHAKPLVSVIMPVYNEEKTVHTVIENLLSREFKLFEIELIIIESRSIDSSREIVGQFSEHPQVKILFQESAKGKGFAVREGLKLVSGDIILFQDADVEYSLDDYPALIEPIIKRESDVVLGNRNHHGGPIRVMEGEKWTSRLTNFGHLLFTAWFNFVYGQKLEDPFTMYKVFRVDCIQGLTFSANRFDFDWELLGKLCRRGFIPLEIPVSYKSRGFKEGKKVRLFKDPITWIVASVKFRFERLP